jgi:hypothetical protein
MKSFAGLVRALTVIAGLAVAACDDSQAAPGSLTATLVSPNGSEGAA